MSFTRKDRLQHEDFEPFTTGEPGEWGTSQLSVRGVVFRCGDPFCGRPIRPRIELPGDYPTPARVSMGDGKVLWHCHKRCGKSYLRRKDKVLAAIKGATDGVVVLGVDL